MIDSRDTQRRRRPSKRAVAWVLGMLAVVLVSVLGAVGWVGSERAIHPKPSEDLPRVEDFALPLEEVRFPSRDGTSLAAWFIAIDGASDAPTIVLLHGYGGRKEEMLPHAEYLRTAGYQSLLLDFRASGASDGDAVSIGAFEQEDALGALDYLETRPEVEIDAVGIQGISLGAAVAIMAGARDPHVRGVVAEAPFRDVPTEVASSFEDRIGLPAFPFAPITVWITERRLGVRAADISPEHAITELAGRPVLVIDDALDDSIAPGSARAVFEAAREPRRYWLVQAEHGEGHRDDPEGYVSEVVRFWDEVFGRPSR